MQMAVMAAMAAMVPFPAVHTAIAFAVFQLVLVHMMDPEVVAQVQAVDPEAVSCFRVLEL